MDPELGFLTKNSPLKNTSTKGTSGAFCRGSVGLTVGGFMSRPVALLNFFVLRASRPLRCEN